MHNNRRHKKRAPRQRHRSTNWRRVSQWVQRRKELAAMIGDDGRPLHPTIFAIENRLFEEYLLTLLHRREQLIVNIKEKYGAEQWDAMTVDERDQLLSESDELQRCVASVRSLYDEHQLLMHRLRAIRSVSVYPYVSMFCPHPYHTDVDSHSFNGTNNSRLRRGQFVELYVMQCLKDAGYDVRRDDVDGRTDFDILIGTSKGWMAIEVKERGGKGGNFTSVNDLPYPTLLIDRKGAFDKKTVRPMAVINVSQRTGAMVFVPVTPKVRRQFRTVSKPNHSGRQQSNYEVPTAYVQSASEFRNHYESLTNRRYAHRYVVG